MLRPWSGSARTGRTPAFGLELVDVSDLASASEVRVFLQALERGGMVKAVRLPDGNRLSRKDLDELIEFVKIFGAQGMAWIKIQTDSWQSPIAKFLSEDVRSRLIERLSIGPGDIVFFVADQSKSCTQPWGISGFASASNLA